MNWRLIEEGSYNASMNMAIDHAIYESVVQGKSLPAIRFYRWKNDSVSIAAYQNENEINFELCKKNNIDVVRRITGGRAVFHDKNDFTYSVIAPINVFQHSITTAYKQICSWIINALKDIHIKSRLENKNDIMVNKKKISGNAAKLMGKEIYLQHGTLIYDIDFDLMPKILNIPKELAQGKITSIQQNKRITRKRVYEILKKSFMKNKKIEIEKILKSEFAVAKDLAMTKYSTINIPKEALLRFRGACYVERGN